MLGIRRRLGEHPFAGRIYAEANGQLVMDLNASDSEPRRRFSCAHEIMHTAFPGFRKEFRYRADPVVETYNRARGEEEYLCDVGAAALIMPQSLVEEDFSFTDALDAVEELSFEAEVSLEAAGNRLAALSRMPAVFLVMEVVNKPADLPRMRRGEEIPPRLRVRYAVVHGMNLYLPKYKSADEDSPFVRALISERVERGTARLPGVPRASRSALKLRPILARDLTVRSRGCWRWLALPATASSPGLVALAHVRGSLIRARKVRSVGRQCAPPGRPHRDALASAWLPIATVHGKTCHLLVTNPVETLGNGRSLTALHTGRSWTPGPPGPPSA